MHMRTVSDLASFISSLSYALKLMASKCIIVFCSAFLNIEHADRRDWIGFPKAR